MKQRKKADLSPHPAVLDDIINVYDCSTERLGEIDVPADLIIGTKTSARTLSFSADFMPVMKPKSEFAAKWRDVCAYHLSDTGIAEAPTAYEYLGRFYIIEGNKRVSVLRSYGAVFITLDVIRLLPPKKNTVAAHRYGKFLNFYQLSKLYSMQFSKGEYYGRFQKLLGFEKDHVWTRMERIGVVGLYGRLKSHFDEQKIKAEYADCFLTMLELYGFEELSAMNDAQMERAIRENRIRLDHGHGPYRIMCVSDEEDLGLWSEYARTELKGIDFMISCGDVKAEYLEFLVTMANKPLFYIHGNHDSRYDSDPPQGCICIDDDLYICQGIRILGLGGSFRYSQDKYQYTEVQMERRIRKLRRKIRKAGGVIIIGVGNAAMDVARTAIRHGSRNVTCFARRDTVSASQYEFSYAKLEGVNFEFNKSPVEIKDDGVIFVDTMVNEEGRAVSVEGSEKFYPSDSVIVSVSQGAMNRIVSTTKGLETNKKGLLVADEHGHTTREGVFTSGDVVSGAKTVVEAVAASKQTAEAMHEYLQSLPKE